MPVAKRRIEHNLNKLVGFTCGKNIGYALIDLDKAAIGDTVTINGYEAVLTEKQFI